MSSSESSEEDCKFDFKNLRRKKKKLASKRFTESPVVVKRKPKDVVAVDEPIKEEPANDSQDLDMLLQSVKAQNEEDNGKEVDLPEIDISDVSIKMRKGRKRKNLLQGLPTGPVNLTEEIERFEHDFAVANTQTPAQFFEMEPEIVEDEKPYVTVYLTVKFSDDFLRIFKLGYEEQFAEKVFLEHALEAGFDDPESFNVVWEFEGNIELLRFYETPKSKGMAVKHAVDLCILPNVGTVREKRKDGQIKLKFNVKGESKPIEKLVGKDDTFAEIAELFAEEVTLKSGQSIRFTFDSEKLAPDDTPEAMDMEELDLIDVIVDSV